MYKFFYRTKNEIGLNIRTGVIGGRSFTGEHQHRADSGAFGKLYVGVHSIADDV